MKTGNKRRNSSSPANGQPRKQVRVDSPVDSENSGPRQAMVGATPPLKRRSSHQRNDKATSSDGHRGHTMQAENVQSCGLTSNDVVDVTTIVNEAENRLTAHVNMLHRKETVEMKGIETAISDLSKKVCDMQSILSYLKVLTTSNSTLIAQNNGSGRGVGSSRKRSISSSLEQEMQNLNPTIPIEIKAVFTVEMFCVSAAQVVSQYMEICHNAQDDVRMTARTITVLLFGLKRDMSRSAFKVGTGRRHANFRFRLAKTVIRNALMITDEAFNEQEQRIIAEAMRSSANGNEQHSALEPSGGKPQWLNQRFLTGPVLDHARRYHECVRAEVGSPPTDPERRKSLTVCRYVVKTTNGLLRVARDRSRQKMFEAGLFLLTDWSKRPAFGDGHTNPTIRFVHQSAVPVGPNGIQDCLRATDENCKTANAGLLSHLIAERKEMQVEATYNVTVVLRSNGRTINREPVTEIREIQRDFNLIRIALVFMEAYVQCKEDSLLSAHPAMLRNIYRLALLLRDFFIDHLDEGCHPMRSVLANSERRVEPCDNKSRQLEDALLDREYDEDDDRPNTQVEDDHDRGSDGNSAARGEGSPKTVEATIKDLLPGESEADKEILKILKISSDAYEKLRVKETGVVHSEEVGTSSPKYRHDGDSWGVDSDDDDLDGMVDV